MPQIHQPRHPTEARLPSMPLSRREARRRQLLLEAQRETAGILAEQLRARRELAR